MHGTQKILRRLGLILFKIYIRTLPKSPYNRNRIKKILIYGNTGLGNFIQFTPAIKRIREIFPEAHITLQTDGKWGGQHVLSGSGIFDDVVIVPSTTGWKERLKQIVRVRRSHYDLIICPLFTSYSTIEVALSGAKFRIRHVFESSLPDVAYNVNVPVREGRHEIDLYCDLVSALGESVPDRKTIFFIDEESKKTGERLLQNLQIDDENFITVQIGAANAMPTAKRWNVEKWIILLNRITDELNIPVVALGDKNEVDLLDTVCHRVKNRMYNLAGKTTVKEAAYIIQQSNLLICHDSGLMHIGVAVDTSVVAIYGPTDCRRTAPRGDKHTVIRKEFDCSPCMTFGGKSELETSRCPHKKCINSVTPNEVFDIVKAKLQGSCK